MSETGPKTDTAQRRVVFTGHPLLALTFISLSVFVISLDAMIVYVAMPTLSRELDADIAQLQWIVDAYTLVIAGLLLAAGSLSDRYGRRGWLIGGLILFGITSLLAAQSDSAQELIAGRAAMGVGAAVIFPTTLALITNIFIDPAARARAIALWAAMTGVGVAVGPVAGGWLIGHFFWGSMFLVNIPVAVIAILGVWCFVPTSSDPAVPPVDIPGCALSVLGLTSLVFTVIEAPSWGWGSLRTAFGFCVAASILAVFVWWQRHTKHPMLDLSIFASRRFSGGSLAVTASFLALFGFTFVITQYLQLIKAYSPLETGVRVLPVAASIAAASLLAPGFVQRMGTTVVASLGLTIFAIGLAWASGNHTDTPYTSMVCQMVLVGAGLGLTTAPATEAIMGSLSTDKAGIGSAVNDTTRELGGTLGVAVVGSIFASVYSSQLASSPHIAQLSVQARSSIERSMTAALQTIERLPARHVEEVHHAVRLAFLDGFRAGTLVCAGVAVAAALAVALILPARARTTEPSSSKRPEREAL